MSQEIIKKGCQSYTFKEKANVVQYALHESNLRSTTKFGLDKTQVGLWVMKLKDKLNEIDHSKSCHLEGSGRERFFPDKEAQLYRWMSEMKDSEIYYNEILDNTNEAYENNPDIDSDDSGENEEDFEYKENHDATIEENEDVLLFTID
ncbi:592_t:CDS:2 [Racocetra fulgida]|uniref:592_t:CDS:1 n=1 Tax=Racocetra fulgida TaxID=60492 RepID=A0A9N9AD43_9GLOM|nr:592_t:CDS:2 [Racocetra fulgida]